MQDVAVLCSAGQQSRLDRQGTVAPEWDTSHMRGEARFLADCVSDMFRSSGAG